MQKIIKGVVVMAMAAELAACKMDQSGYEERALHMLEEKYDEKFTIWQYAGREFTRGYFTVICSPEEAQDILFETRVANDGSYIEDDYVSAVVCDQAERQIDENLEYMEGYLLEKVVPVSKSLDSADADMSVEEFMSLKPGNRFAVYLMYCPQERGADKAYKELQKAFSGLDCMSGNIQLYVMQEEELKEMQGYLAEMTEPDSGFEERTEGKKRITIPFEKGILQMSDREFAEEAGGVL
ncbi:MAG: hypothetical protein K1W22_15360 [Lachnospiraceae bacterium]